MSRHRTARLFFLGALAFNAALTLFWLVTFLRGHSFFYSDYTVDGPTIRRILGGLRITDMIGRRGRFITPAAAGLYSLYVQLNENPNASFARCARLLGLRCVALLRIESVHSG